MEATSLMRLRVAAIKALWGEPIKSSKYRICHLKAFNSFLVHIDENGDAGGNYTILGMKSTNNVKTNQSTYGLFPVGTFITRTNLSDSIPVRLWKKGKWN